MTIDAKSANPAQLQRRRLSSRYEAKGGGVGHWLLVAVGAAVVVGGVVFIALSM
jgi:hypothetical protein